MRRIMSLVALLGALASGEAFAGWIDYDPLTIDAGSTSTRILAAPDPVVTNTWTTSTAYAYGDYVMYSNRFFWSITSGISTSGAAATNAPVAADGDDARDLISWRAVRRQRGGLYISTVTTGKFNLGFGNAAVVGKGIYLDSSKPFRADAPSVPQGEVYAITEAGTLAVLVQEW